MANCNEPRASGAESLLREAMVSADPGVTAFGVRLNALRRARLVTRADLAAAVGVAESEIENCELKNAPLSGEVLAAICDYFKVPEEYLIAGKDFSFDDLLCSEIEPGELGRTSESGDVRIALACGIFGRRLKALRRLRNHTRDEFAASVNLDLGIALESYESGAIIMSSSLLNRTAKYLDVDPNELLRGRAATPAPKQKSGH